MLISAIQKTTLLDYPGKVATIIFTTGCNLRCSYCHNSEFVLPEEIKLIKDFIPEKVFFNFLKTRVGILDGVVICGGEPTINKDLYDFCKNIKDLGFLVKIDTNGQNPEVLERLINDGLVDYLAMDVKNSFSKYALTTQVEEDIEKYKKSIELIKKSGIDYEFRTTLVNPLHTFEDIIEIAKALSGAKKYYLQNYKGGNTLVKDFNGKSFSKSKLKEFKKLSKDYIENVYVREYDE
ncbi:MAG: anaerobic ribonucleoside-triphosphate reductase activating protein [Candidatus Gracilibacteria bacterium]|nr:anaerobic ribonucleoside-triphosphate reductase activating protein [Candidatus Gracilibacteria bacterium]